MEHHCAKCGLRIPLGDAHTCPPGGYLEAIDRVCRGVGSVQEGARVRAHISEQDKRISALYDALSSLHLPCDKLPCAVCAVLDIEQTD